MTACCVSILKDGPDSGAWVSSSSSRVSLGARPKKSEADAQVAEEAPPKPVKKRTKKAEAAEDSGEAPVAVKRTRAKPKAAASPPAAARALGTPELKNVYNASVGQFVRVALIPGSSSALLGGDWTGSFTRLDLASGDALYTNRSAGVASVHNHAFVESEGLVLCGGGWTGKISALELESGQPRFALDIGVGEYVRVAYSESASLGIFAGGALSAKVAGVEPSSGKVRWLVDSPIGATWTISASPISSSVVLGGSWTRPGNSARLWALDAATGETLFDVDPGVGKYVQVAYLKSGAVACGGEQGKVAVLDPKSGAPHFTADAGVGEVSALREAAEANMILCAGSWAGLISGLDGATGKVLLPPTNATIGKIFSVTYLPELQLAVCGGSTGMVAGIEIPSGDLKFVLDTSLGEVWSLAYEPTSNVLLCSGRNHSIATISL